jgi:hypothetical protein
MLTEQVIEDGSLAAADGAFTFRLRMPWYRSLPLSSLEGLEVTLDGETVPSDELRISLDGAAYGLTDLPPLYDRWWYVADAAEVRAPWARELGAGVHELDVTIALRIPYIVESGHPLVMRERCVKQQVSGGSR